MMEPKRSTWEVETLFEWQRLSRDDAIARAKREIGSEGYDACRTLGYLYDAAKHAGWRQEVDAAEGSEGILRLVTRHEQREIAVSLGDVVAIEQDGDTAHLLLRGNHRITAHAAPGANDLVQLWTRFRRGR